MLFGVKKRVKKLKLENYCVGFFDAKTFMFSLVIISSLLFIGKGFILSTHTTQVSVYFLDAIPKHTKRWRGGIKEVSPARWQASMLFEGKNVNCDITKSLYSTLKMASNNKRYAQLSYHYSMFSDEIVCERLDVLMN